MTDHEQVRAMLALSAAGLLDAEGERRLREHTAICEACRAELDAFAQLADGLRQMPAAAPPADLLSRTLVLAAAEADRREGARLATAAAVCAGVLLWALAVTLNIGVLVWFVWTFIPSVLGAAAAFMLASRRNIERSVE